MKKILIIIAIVFCIFQMIVLATAIDIGSAAIDRDTQTFVTNRTFIDKNNPANDAGKITLVEIFAYSAMTGVEVAIFYGSGNWYSTRDWAAIGDVPIGYSAYEVNLDVEAGDYIGFYSETGTFECTNAGEGYWYHVADAIPHSGLTFSFIAGRAISVYGTGATEEEEEEANAIFFGTNF